MKRVVVGVAALSLVLLAPEANAAVTAGAKCAKLGQTSVVGSKKYTCVKSGKKLVWSKPVTITKPTTPTALPTPPKPNPLDVLLLPTSPSVGSNCAKNGDEQFAVVGPIRCVASKWTLVGFADDSVMTRSYRNIWTRWQQVKDDPVSSEIVTDPKTDTWKVWAATGFEGGAKYWRSNSEKMLVRAIVGPDWKWMDAKAKELGWQTGETFKSALNTRPWDSIATNKGTEDNDSIDKPWVHILVEGDPYVGINVIAHEFGHVAQIYFSKGRFFRTPSRVPWLDEGMPSLVGAALSPLVGMRYNTRDEWIVRITDYDVRLIDVSDTRVTPGSSPLFWRAYAAGFFASEALISLYGAECLDDIYRGVSNGGSWNESFIKIFGIGIAQTSDVLDGYVQSVRAGKPLTLKELSDRLKSAGATTPKTGWIS